MMYNLFLDDIRVPSESIISYPSGMDWVVVRSMDEAVAYVEKHGVPAVISFDHDLADTHYNPDIEHEKTGYHFAKWICDHIMDNNLSCEFKFYVHSMNPVGKKNIEYYLRNFMRNYNVHPVA